MIANLRGASGCGKSYVGHALVRRASTEVFLPPGHPWNNRKSRKLFGYELPGSLFVVGRYTSACGGAESMTAEHTRELVRRLGQVYDHVFLEGLFISVSVGPWVELAHEVRNLRAAPFVVLALNTPYDVTVERVQQRNGGKPVNISAHYNNWKRIPKAVVPRFTEAGVDTRWVDWTRSFEHVTEILETFGYEMPSERPAEERVEKILDITAMV